MSNDFSINFGNVRPLEFNLPEEGTYRLRITGFELKEAKNPDSRAKGFNIALQFTVVDAPDYGGIVYHNLWVQRDNPFAAKAFFEALTGKDLSEEELDITDATSFMGEEVGASLIHETYESKLGVEKTKLSIPSFDSFYPVD